MMRFCSLKKTEGKTSVCWTQSQLEEGICFSIDYLHKTLEKILISDITSYDFFTVQNEDNLKNSSFAVRSIKLNKSV